LRVLVTGSAGRIGAEVVRDLGARGYTLRTMDRRAAARDSACEHYPGDVCNILDVRRAVSGMDAVVHLAAIASDRRGSEDQVLTTNVQGTWNVLLACQEAGAKRAVVMSSINSLGCFGGHKPAIRLPIDDTYPHHPMTPYHMSKHLLEELCRMFSHAHGIVTLCPRPVSVIGPEQYTRWREHRSMWRREWGRAEYWSYVDIRDVCEAVRRSLEVEDVLHECFLLAAPDTFSDTPTAELVAENYPDTPWAVDRDAYLARGPYVSLLDSRHVEEVLGWRPMCSWRDEGTGDSSAAGGEG